MPKQYQIPYFPNQIIQNLIWQIYAYFAKEYLHSEMMKASDELQFEKAAEYRDMIKSVMHIAQKQKINDNNELDDKDVIVCVTEYSDVLIQVFFIRNGKLVGREHYYMNSEVAESESEIINTFIKQFYSGTPFLPKTILWRG